MTKRSLSGQAQATFQRLCRHQVGLLCQTTLSSVYTDTNRAYHATAYRTNFLGTEQIYRFQSFVLIDHTAEELRASGNPFGFALEAARNALDIGSKDDQQLLVGKLDMMRHLLSCGLSKAKIRRLYNFITYYTAFQNLENKLKFEDEVQKITKSRKAMGLEEAILQEVKEQGYRAEPVFHPPIDQTRLQVINCNFDNGKS